jgi:putative ABC transport system substrate-binding protein
MLRRTIGLLVTLALLFVPLATAASPPTPVHRIGWLASTTPTRPFLEAFLEGMRALGYVEGQHFVLESRGADGQSERFPALAAELVRLPVDVLLAVGDTPAQLAAKDATTTIPIVMDTGKDSGQKLMDVLYRSAAGSCSPFGPGNEVCTVRAPHPPPTS